MSHAAPTGSRRSPAVSRLRDLERETSGSVALIFAISIFVLFGFVGGALDFTRVIRARSAFQGSLDAAVLAAARIKQVGGTDTEAIAAAEAFIAPVRLRIAVDGDITFSVTDNGTTILGVATLSQPTTFLRTIGIDKLPFRNSGMASFGSGTGTHSDVELVMMLDVTGSMSGQKLVDLQGAARDLIDIVVADDQSRSKSRVGMAPFSRAVKLDQRLFEGATGKLMSSGPYAGCVAERTGTDALTDERPASGSYVTPLEDVAPSSPCESAEVVPLSDQKVDLKTAVDGLSAGGATAGHLGTAWAWYLLSPNWKTLFDSKSHPGQYSELTNTLSNGEPKLKKIAVLMTDGEYNVSYSGGDATTQARSLCAQMKLAGIIVYTVGFDLGGNAAAIETLQGCASDASKFYNATTGDALRASFRDIALKSMPLRLTQ